MDAGVGMAMCSMIRTEKLLIGRWQAKSQEGEVGNRDDMDNMGISSCEAMLLGRREYDRG